MPVATAAQRRTSAEQDQSPVPLRVGTLPPCPDLRVSLDWAGTCPGGAHSSLELAGGLWNPPQFPLVL